MEFLSANDVSIDYEIGGEGPPVLLIHGFASNARVNWVDTSWVRTLNRAGYQAITFDNRGHGRSGKVYEPDLCTTDLMAEDAKRLIEHLGHASVSVIGYSMGARVAAVLMLRYPEFVSAAVLGGLAENMMKGLGYTEEISAALEADRPPAGTDEKVLAYRRFAEQTGSDLKALAVCMRASRRVITAEELKGVKVPVLVVAGSEDATAGAVEPLVKVFARGRGLVVPGRDHMNAVGDRLFKEEAVKFLDSVRLGGEQPR